MRKLLFILTIWLAAVNLQAMPAQGQVGQLFDTRYPITSDWTAASLLYLAEKSSENVQQPESGSLVVPGEEEKGAGKKCMNVCKSWGEDCQINPRTGARKCRRTCKEFGQECF